MTPSTLLAWARLRIPAAEARSLLAHVLGHNSAWIEAHRDDPLDEASAERFSALAARRAAGEPVAYLLGQREFFGREFSVSPSVLIPRPETELLVERALSELAVCTAPRVLDMGTGSGCIAITLALECPTARVDALDASPAAIAVARENAQRLKASVSFIESHWFGGLPAGACYEVIVANPPYIAAGDPHLDQGDLRFEPATALAAGTDGLDDIRLIVAGAPRYLCAGGALLLEHGYDQAEAIAVLLKAKGFVNVASHADLAGIPRVTQGSWPG